MSICTQKTHHLKREQEIQGISRSNNTSEFCIILCTKQKTCDFVTFHHHAFAMVVLELEHFVHLDAFLQVVEHLHITEHTCESNQHSADMCRT